MGAVSACESLGNLWSYPEGMFGLNHNGFIDLSTSVLFQNNLYLLIFCIIASTPLLKNIGTYIKRLDLVHYRIPYLTYAYEIVIPPVLLILHSLRWSETVTIHFYTSSFKGSV